MALLHKWKWRWVQDRSLMWCHIAEARYRVGGAQGPHFPRETQRVSRIWRDILSITGQFSDAIRWKVGDGRSTLFWHDHWIGVGPFSQRFQRIAELSVAPWGRVRHFCAPQGHTGSWTICLTHDLDAEEEELFSYLLLELSAFDLQDNIIDVATWNPQPRHGFTVRSCYNWIRRDHPHLSHTASKWKEIWGPRIPLKVKAFIWMLFQEKLLTKTYRAKWSQQQDILCPMCESAEETTEHLFVHCPVALRLWALLHDAIDFDLQTLSLQGLWEASKKLKPTGDRSPGGKVSQSLVPVVLWALWLARNSRVFRNTRVYHENIWETAVFFIKAWGRACIDGRWKRRIWSKIEREDSRSPAAKS
ncbi:hypothetical protein QJS10_CPA09g00934 [Acorus calamus]|uniref:Reverse transcriptase zinc-binding domain-containing protein n=1 Tax=Acorus calamus TaxID=4465 RepID=A0AAV9E7C9_ACOCL|nr:hypothetical protein QJS10_CPA09g00934 [Acorus calamus]